MSDSRSPEPGSTGGGTGRRHRRSGSARADRFGDPVRPGRLTETERRAVLDRAVARYLQNGYRVERISDRRAVVAKRQRIYLLPNLLLVLVTGGLWLVVLGIRLLNWPTDRATLTVTDAGELQGEFSS